MEENAVQHKHINDCSYGSDGSNPDACSSPAVPVGKSGSQAVSAHSPGNSPAEIDKEDVFYERLDKINEPWGLSLLFNFRKTNMDLYQFYKMVTERGGYHQVTRDESWEDVALELNLKDGIPIVPSQLKKLYASILYRFEQTYHYRTPAKPNKAPMMLAVPIGYSSNTGHETICSTGKRKHCDSPCMSPSHFSNRETPSKKVEYDEGSGRSSPVDKAEEKKPVLDTPPKVKEVRKDPHAPVGARNCYQIFFKIECDRLKRIHRDSSPGELRSMAIEAWRRLSDDDKQPYIAASKKDKERFVREMAAYKLRKEKQQTETKSKGSASQGVINFSNPRLVNFPTLSSQEVEEYHVISHADVENSTQNLNKVQKLPSFTNQTVIDFAKTSTMQTDGDYHVALQADDADKIPQLSDELMVQVAVGLMKNARPNDPIFQINWDDYSGSLDNNP